ncbi:MAG: hypothetical protein IT450_13990 [Phycisphaerales bacterium]|nr:hypothetical protein [Phycisphaerales bacterium]
MTIRVITGSKEEIAERVAALEGRVREAIVFVDEPLPPPQRVADLFAEMEPYTVRATDVDDSRDAIYRRGAGE